MRKFDMAFSCCLLAGLLASGCSSAKSEQAEPSTVRTSSAMRHRSSSEEWIEGSVTEVIDVGDYRYVCVNADKRSVWLAATISGVGVGDVLQYQEGLLMRDFQSPSLGRKFPEILFVDHVRVKARAPVAVRRVPGLPSGHPVVPQSSRSTKRNLPAPEPDSLPILPDTESIRAIETGRGDFTGQVVSVVGLVSRVNPDIMGKTWIHLLDDQGGELIATTSMKVDLGSVVMARGRISVNKTFNNGYYLPLLLEDARINPIDAGRSAGSALEAAPEPGGPRNAFQPLPAVPSAG